MKDESKRVGLEISDSEDGFLVVDLRQIIDALGPLLPTLHWRLLSLWAVGELPGPRCVADYEKLAESSEGGLALNWDELVLLADNTDQIVELVLVGQRKPTTLKGPASSTALVKGADLQIEAIDGCLWRVVSRDDSHIERLRQVFNEVKPVPEGELG